MGKQQIKTNSTKNKVEKDGKLLNKCFLSVAKSNQLNISVESKSEKKIEQIFS